MVVFFDIDDTLIDHTTAMRAAAMALHAHSRVSRPLEEFVTHWFDAHRNFYPRYLNREITYETLRRQRVRATIDADLSDRDADELFETYFDHYTSRWTLFPDVLPCLDRLRDYCRLGIISNGRSEEQRRKLIHTGIVNRFESILISDECGWAKPGPEIFRAACRAIGVEPKQAIYIGDQRKLDAAAATNAGLHGVWLDRHRIASPTDRGVIVNSLDEINVPEMLGTRFRTDS